MAVRILLVDDHEIVRRGIRNLIENSGRGWEVCGEAEGGPEAVQAAQALRPDVIVLDFAMPKGNGIEAAGHIRRLGLSCRIILFTMYESKRLGDEAATAGAQGYVLKSQAARDLLLAIERVLAGGTFFGQPADCPSADESTPPGEKLLFFRALGLCGA